jgi:hypothetical protein
MWRARRYGFSDMTCTGAVGLEDNHRAGRTDAVAVKEDHDLAHDLLLGPGGGNAAGPHWTDPIHLLKATGFGFDHVEHLLAKDPHQLLGVDRADATDHARREEGIIDPDTTKQGLQVEITVDDPATFTAPCQRS